MKRWMVMIWLVWMRGAAATVPAPADHWAFQPVRSPEPPAVRQDSWCRTPLDRFILGRLEAAGVAPTPAADRRTLIRRVSFDLTGLPPTAGEVDSFVSDPSPDAYARLVDRLLDSPHYGEHWGRHWLDVVRYADTAGETADYPVPVAWRYRNYVIDAFNQDKPYDQFLREQIAGDILARSGSRENYSECVTATGFLAISRRFGFDSENYHHLTIQDTIDTVGQSVLGLSLGCARCHAHKFDPIPMQDYYALYGIFDSTRYAFPGSEQKQRTRALVPLVPPGESESRWRDYETRIATLSGSLERQKQSAPSAVLRSLDDLDGDFELQAPAAGGSKGVLVPPWVYDGPIAVTTDAQSPYRNAHPLGRVGASVPDGVQGYRLAQSLHPTRHRGDAPVHVNLDFRISTNAPGSGGRHRFWLGSSRGSAAVEVLMGVDSVAVRTGDRVEILRSLQAGKWHNVQLDLDPRSGEVRGRVGVPGDVTEFPARSMSPRWDGTLDFVGVDASDAGQSALPGLAVDNLAVQAAPLAAVSVEIPGLAQEARESDSAALLSRIQELAGIDGDFELQTAGSAPAAPWHPGPKSTVIIHADAQSPFLNIYPAGRLGVRLPNREVYNGYGQTLARRWERTRDSRMHAGFDFRCSDVSAGDGGTWRFYLGHGAGSSAAVELEMNGTEFLRRSGDDRSRVCVLQVGEWYQVQLTVNLKDGRYSGVIASRNGRSEFEGAVASGWDGVVDYTFVDSYGSRGGVKPGLDVDNFVLSETALPALGASGPALSDAGRDARRREIASLRNEIARRSEAGEQMRRELKKLLSEGPFELAYAVSEGTPRNARMQLRGEPDKLGEEVPRGFLSALGGGPLPPETSGSGRLELAEWLTSPTHPLTARVMVNRIWEYHFGQGLVRTPNDFGARGHRPTHPELLDYLASAFVRNGWSLKSLHRTILLSATYRQQSRFTPGREPVGNPIPADECPVLPTGNPRKSGPAMSALGSDLISPFARRRLRAEETRDAILAASGELDPSPGTEHPFPAPTDWGYTQHGPYSAVYDHQRRSVYLMTQRIKRHPFLALFDGADPNSSTPDRRVTTVPTQALYFLNDPFVHRCSEALAARVIASGRTDPDRIRELYRRVLGRDPTAGERADAEAFLSAYRGELKATEEAASGARSFAGLGRVLFGSNEFLTVD
ncbi:MAG: DUF1549 domain-containing protein [Verrucomicrobiales bacterium]|nr:DUF1549 domain-containing protein [Verrucomicrobiales bacterium]